MSALNCPMATPLHDLLAYREDLTDALSGGAIDDDTKLVALHQPNRHTYDGELIQNLTGVARPAKACFMVVKNEIYPPFAVHGRWVEAPYFLFMTFNRLLTAPVIRLECIWDLTGLPNTPGNVQLFRVALEFHFNATDDGTPGVSHFRILKGIERLQKPKDEMLFTAHGATSEGFDNALRFQNYLGDHGQRVLAELRSFIKPDAPKKARFRFFQPLEANDSAVASVLPYVCPGPNQLPSLSLPEWSSLLPLRADRDVRGLIDSPSLYPMVPFQSRDTYATVTDASVELYESARVAHLEQEVATREWASVAHKGITYEVGGAAVMAVKFQPFRPLGGPSGVVNKFDLPDRLSTKMSWTVPATQAVFQNISGSRCCLPLRLPTPYDALFVISNPTPELRAACIKPSEVNALSAVQVLFQPKITRFTLESQLTTAVNIQQSHRWHQTILNQSHRDLNVVDLALSRVPDVTEPPIEEAVEKAFQTIMKWQTWNTEQKAALHSMRHAVGGIVLITGPAGTGKTLVLQAICVFLFRLGIHVLVLAPANSNCADFMRKLLQHFPEVNATRVFPPSTDFSPEKIGEKEQQKAKDVEPSDSVETADTTDAGDTATGGDLFDFDMVRAHLQSGEAKYSDFADYGLPARVLKAARDGSFSLKERDVDVWAELRSCIELSDARKFNWLDKKEVDRYQRCYNACKAHHMAVTPVVVTTTGNVRCNDIVDNFAMNKYNFKCQGLVVVLDEACKDREIDSLSPLLHPSYRDKITGVIMLGDERQLEPTNTSAKGKVTFNPFNERLSIPLLTRLKRQGFPCVELVEQHRMSHHVSRWPSKNFYPEGMRDGPTTQQLLCQKQPGLFACLKGILNNISTCSQSQMSDPVEEDRRIRTQYVDIRGKRDNSKLSAVVREHIKFFFQHVYWNLKAYYGEKMEENVMVICAYKEAKHCWHEAVAHLEHKYQIPGAQMPRILTIDSSQGTEAPITFIDCSVQHYCRRTRRKDIGFVDDDKRMNVAMTRAQEVRWFLGGSCSVDERRLGMANTPAYVRFRDEAEGTVEVSQAKNRYIERDYTTWLDDLAKKEVEVKIRFTDEADSSDA